jgi:hypothetical protein
VDLSAHLLAQPARRQGTPAVSSGQIGQQRPRHQQPHMVGHQVVVGHRSAVFQVGLDVFAVFDDRPEA